ncbi:MAG: ABC transporter permease [Parachlamydia sp.]|nr:MAG: ABC transporter permease [Parachlamydia sp.]
MKAYSAVLKARLSVLLQYRSAALAGLATQIFWGFIKVMILEAFYAQSGAAEPLTLAQAITFIWLGQAFLQLIPWNIDKELEQQIKTGNVAYELLRPLDLYFLWFFRAVAMRLVPALMRSIPLFLFAGVVYALPAPVSLHAAIAFIFSLSAAILLSSAITTLVIISLFWTISGEGIQRLLPHITLLLSGMTVPLPLFPSWTQPFLNLQPFRGIIDIPSRIYVGIIPTHDVFQYIGFQLVWFLFFVLAGKWLLKRAIKRFVILGG